MALAPIPAPGRSTTRPSPSSLAERRAEGAAQRNAFVEGLPEHTVALSDPDNFGWACHVMDAGPIKDGTAKPANHFVPLPELVDWLFDNTAGYRVITQVHYAYGGSRLYVAIEFKNDVDAVHFKMRWL